MAENEMRSDELKQLKLISISANVSVNRAEVYKNKKDKLENFCFKKNCR